MKNKLSFRGITLLTEKNNNLIINNFIIINIFLNY